MGDYATQVNIKFGKGIENNPYKVLSNFKTTGGILTPVKIVSNTKNTEMSEISNTVRGGVTPITNQTLTMKELLSSALVSKVKELKENFMEQNNEHIKQLQKMN